MLILEINRTTIPASSIPVLAGLVGLVCVSTLVAAFDCHCVFVHVRAEQLSVWTCIYAEGTHFDCRFMENQSHLDASSLTSQLAQTTGSFSESSPTLSPAEIKKPQQRLRGATHHHHGEKHNEDCGGDEKGMSLACASRVFASMQVSERRKPGGAWCNHRWDLRAG